MIWINAHVIFPFFSCFSFSSLSFFLIFTYLFLRYNLFLLVTHQQQVVVACHDICIFSFTFSFFCSFPSFTISMVWSGGSRPHGLLQSFFFFFCSFPSSHLFLHCLLFFLSHPPPFSSSSSTAFSCFFLLLLLVHRLLFFLSFPPPPFSSSAFLFFLFLHCLLFFLPPTSSFSESPIHTDVMCVDTLIPTGTYWWLEEEALSNNYNY